jgi:hypothetical protein
MGGSIDHISGQFDVWIVPNQGEGIKRYLFKQLNAVLRNDQFILVSKMTFL